MKRTDQYLYLANGRLHRSLFGAINEKGEVKIVKDNQVLTRMNEKQAKALGNIARKNWTIKNQYLLYIFMEVLPEGLHME